MYSFEGHTQKAFRNVFTAANEADKAGGTLDRRMTEAFVAALAADPAATSRTVSQMIGDKVPQSKESGNPSATRKSWNVSFFKDTANVAAVRAAIPNADHLTPDDFQKAVETYAATLNVRAAAKARTEAKKAAAPTPPPAREPDAEEEGRVLNPDFDPVLDARTRALEAVALLVEMTGNNDPETAQGARDALSAILDAVIGTEEAREVA